MTRIRPGESSLAKSASGETQDLPIPPDDSRPIEPSPHSPQQGHTARFHPFDDKDIPVAVEASVVWMHELARQPFFRLTANLESIQYLLSPFWIIAQMHDRLVVLVE